MTLSLERKKSLIDYRVEKAFATLREAKDVALLNHWSLAINRMYYASYYAMSALLLTKDIQPHTHAGVIKMMHLYFIKEGKISVETGSVLKKLFIMRQTGDYEDTFDWDKEDVEEFLPLTENFVTEIISLIRN